MTFRALDNYMWTLIYERAPRGHANKPRMWIVTRYFGEFNKSRNDHSHLVV